MKNKENFIVGLYGADKKALEYLSEFKKEIEKKGCDIGFWWSGKPKDEVIEQLKDLKNKIGYFYFYIFSSGNAIALLKIDDFHIFEDVYNDNLPDNWKICGHAEEFFNKGKRKKLLDKAIQEKKKPKIIFKVKEIIFFDNKKTSFEGNPNPNWIGQDMTLDKFLKEFKNEEIIKSEIDELKKTLGNFKN